MNLRLLSFFRLLSVYCTPRVIAVFFLGFASGLPLVLTASTLSVWMTEIGVNIKTIGLFAAVATPYSLKFLWSPLVDQLELPIIGKWLGRRTSWMILSQAVLMVLLVLLGASDPYEMPFHTAMLAFMVAVASATQDIVIDAYRVELLNPEEQGAGAAVIVFGYRIGMLVSGAGALFLAGDYDWSTVYDIMACLLAVGTVTCLIAGEPKRVAAAAEALSVFEKAARMRNRNVDNWQWVKNMVDWLRRAVISPFLDFMRNDHWLLILLFVMLYKLADALAGVMTNPFLIETGFSKVEIATIVKTYGLFATLAGSFMGGILIYRLGLLRSLWVCGILQMLSNLMFSYLATVGYDTRVLEYTIGIENFTSGMGTAAFVAYLSSLCNIAYTATQYALLSSLSSVGRTLLSTGSGYIVDKLDWFYFFIFSTSAGIPGLILLYLLQRKIARKQMLQVAV